MLTLIFPNLFLLSCHTYLTSLSQNTPKSFKLLNKQEFCRSCKKGEATEINGQNVFGSATINNFVRASENAGGHKKLWLTCATFLRPWS